MKVKRTTRDFYRTNIVNNIIGLEEKRKLIIKKIMWEQLLPAVALISVSLIFAVVQKISFEIVIAICGLIFIYSWWFYDTILQQQILNFKQSVISDMVSFVDQQLNYQPEQKVSQGELINSRIVRDKIDYYTGEEYIEGDIGEVNLKFSKVVAKSEVKGTIRDVNWDTLLEGILFVADFGQEFNFDLIIETDIAEQVFEGLKQSMQRTAGVLDNPFAEGKVMRVNDSEFEEQFKVIGTNRQAVEQFLNDQLRKKILQLKKEVGQHKQVIPCLKNNKITKKEIFLSFVGSKLYITVPFKGRKIFTPDIFSPYKQKFRDLKYYFDVLRKVVEIIEEVENNKLA